MPDKVQAYEFLELADYMPIIDVRSPGEYKQGHIPGAVNIPLFENNERASVGTLYVQQGREEAIQQGLKYIAPKLQDFIEKALPLSPKKELLVHCWRGGMRSESLSEYYEANGFKVKLLEGGYKAYRQYIRQQFKRKMKIVLLGGTTGSGKTFIIKELGKLGEQIIDLEELANHKGSVFGHLGQPEQPTTEQFENNLFMVWNTLDSSSPVWIELESSQIGKVFLPDTFHESMLEGEMIEIVRPVQLRIKHLVDDYAGFDNKFLVDSLERIKMRMGLLNYQKAMDALAINDYENVANIVLDYYDKTYENGLAKRPVKKILTLELPDPDNSKCASEVISTYNNLKSDQSF